MLMLDANRQDHTSSNCQVQIKFVSSSIMTSFGSKPSQAIVMKMKSSYIQMTRVL